MKIIYDVFPARVRVAPPRSEVDTYVYENLTVLSAMENSRLVDRVRVVITEETVMIAADSHRGPTLIFQEKYDPATLHVTRGRRQSGRLTTVAGKILVFEKDENCGCGSMLRAWNPYRTVYSTKDPIE